MLIRPVLLLSLAACLAGCTNQPQPQPAPLQCPEAAAAHVNAGDAAFAREDFVAAAREYGQALAAGDDRPIVHFRYGYAVHVNGDPAGALPHHIAATKIDNPALRIDALYNCACACALLGRREEALGYFSRAIHAGFKDIEQVRKDTDLDSLRGDAEFQRLVGAVKPEHNPPAR